LHIPGGPGVRIDSAIYQGYTIPPFYDSMIAKLICHGNTRSEALSRLKRALAEFLFDGITTNSDFQMQILK
jgi:acetyl-CoA carboxylase biotin carboxylase subunit